MIRHGLQGWHGRRRRLKKLEPRLEVDLSKPIHDLSILCWDLKALPTHHLPFAGFGFRQPHWLILKCDVENSRIHSDLEREKNIVRKKGSLGVFGRLGNFVRIFGKLGEGRSRD